MALAVNKQCVALQLCWIATVAVIHHRRQVGARHFSEKPAGGLITSLEREEEQSAFPHDPDRAVPHDVQEVVMDRLVLGRRSSGSEVFQACNFVMKPDKQSLTTEARDVFRAVVTLLSNQCLSSRRLDEKVTLGLGDFDCISAKVRELDRRRDLASRLVEQAGDETV